MSQTKKSWNGRGRPKKGFDNIKETKFQNNNISEEQVSRGRPKKVRKIDDSINTQIDSHKKSVAKLEKVNNEISKWIGISTFSSEKIEQSNWGSTDFEFNNNQKADNFARIILICSMVFFILALWKAFVSNQRSFAELQIRELSRIQADQIEPLDNMDEWQENIDESVIVNSEENNEVNDELTIDDNNENIITDTSYTENYAFSDDIQIIQNFYGYINILDFSNINASVDKYLKNSDVFRTYFSQNRLTNFINKISNNWLSISNIQLESGDENSTRYYLYDISYQLKDSWEYIQEQRESAIVKRNDQYLIWSIRCVTTWCSKMPFFQK